MKLSKRGEYALRALIDLGIASELGWPMLQISELAAKEKLPIKFLEQIFTQLRAAGYVESRRGKFGGYSLAHPMVTFSGLFVKNRAKTTMIITKTPPVILSKSPDL